MNIAIESLRKELQRSPRISEIAERMKIPEEAVIEALEANNAYRARTLDQSGRNTPVGRLEPRRDLESRGHRRTTRPASSSPTPDPLLEILR